MTQKITSENYVAHALRTDCILTMELIARLTDPDTIRLLHAAMGLVTEAGEFMDMLKKHIFAGKPLDKVNAVEELGDSQWYSALAIDVLRTTLSEVMTININKLKLRYPEKFTEDSCINRDVVSERNFLENVVEDCEVALSERGKDWIKFSDMILQHTEDYTVPQYGDKGEDQCTDYSAKECVLQAQKYLSRFGKNQREGQQELDFLKASHYLQMAHDKYIEEKEAGI